MTAPMLLTIILLAVVLFFAALNADANRRPAVASQRHLICWSVQGGPERCDWR